jgi:hypothetical protein
MTPRSLELIFAADFTTPAATRRLSRTDQGVHFREKDERSVNARPFRFRAA